MALPAAGVIEVRSTASDLNPGMFVPGGSGADRTLQDAPWASGTNLAVDASISTDVQPDGYTVAVGDDNNTIRIPTGVAGWTPGVYQIVSRQGAKWRLDRSPAAVGTNGGTWRMGGALASPGMAGGTKVTGNLIYIKAGTYTLTTASANVSGGVVSDTTGGTDTTGQCFWVGYDTDRSIWNFDANRPLILVPAAGVASCTVFAVSGLNVTVRNLVVDGASKTAIRGFHAAANFGGVRIFGCKAQNCTDSGFFSHTGENAFFTCESTGCSGTGGGFGVNNGSPRFFACWSHDNTVHGFSAPTGVLAHFERCLATSNLGASSDGFGASGLSSLHYCSAYGSGRDGFRITGASRSATIVNCLAVGNGGYGFGSGGAANNAAYLQNCAAFGNTSGNLDSVNLASVVGFLNLSGDPFANAAGGNFALNSVAGAGALLRGAGFPSAFPGGLTAQAVDIGAAQHPESGSAGYGPRTLVQTVIPVIW